MTRQIGDIGVLTDYLSGKDFAFIVLGPWEWPERGLRRESGEPDMLVMVIDGECHLDGLLYLPGDIGPVAHEAPVRWRSRDLRHEWKSEDELLRLKWRTWAELTKSTYRGLILDT